MAFLLYLLVKSLQGLLGLEDTFPYDWQVLCGLLALEGPGYLNALRLWRLSRR